MSTIKVPYILTCQVTGIQKAYTSVDFVQRKIENYGDEAAMVAGYVCRDAKKALKAFDLEKLTVDDVKGVITSLNGTTDAQAVFDLIKGGKLFLTKKTKVRVKKAPEAPAADVVPAPDAPAAEAAVTTEAPAQVETPAPVADAVPEVAADVPATETAPVEAAAASMENTETIAPKKSKKSKKKSAEAVENTESAKTIESASEATNA